MAILAILLPPKIAVGEVAVGASGASNLFFPTKELFVSVKK